MNSSKPLICPERRRQIPTQFSWVDHRLVRDQHLDRLDVVAAALYLFLITVADCQGLSWYGDASTARRLSIDDARLRRARDDLTRADLIAYSRPLYQVLALGDPPIAAALPPRMPPRMPAPTTSAAVATTAIAIADRSTMRAHIAVLRATLARTS